MKYVLSVYTNYNDHEDITGYKSISGIPNLDENKLEDIYSFLATFNNQYELKHFLYEHELISEKGLKGAFWITAYNGKNTKKLIHGISFGPDKERYNYNAVESYYRRHINDPLLMTQFLEHYKKYFEKSKVFTELLDILKKYNVDKSGFDITEDEAITTLETFLKLYCFKKDKEGKYIQNFRAIRDLVSIELFTEHTRGDRAYNPYNNREELELVQLQIEQITEEIDYYENLITEETDELVIANYEEHIFSLNRKLDILKTKEEVLNNNSLVGRMGYDITRN